MTAVPLKTLCQIRNGGTPSKANPAFWDGSIPWVSPKDMKAVALSDAADHITQEAVNNSATSVVPVQSILVVVRSGILAHSLPVAQATKPLAFNQDIKALIPNPLKVDPDYLFWFVRSQERHVLAQGVKKGATVHSLQSGFIENLQIPMPERSEQRRIVDLLCRAEGIVRLRREAEKKSGELIPALFLEMFGDPATNPKGWRKVELGELCIRITDGTHQPPKFQEAGIPFIFVANIVKGELTLDAAKFISEKTYIDLTRRCPIEQGDVLYSTVGSYGVAVKVNTDERFAFQRHIAHLKPNQAELNADFLVGMLSTPALMAQADATARGVAQKTINLGEIRKFQVIAPPHANQSQFAAIVESIRSIQSQQSSATAKAKAAFDALLARTYSGV
jgi:type I restriction enzyme, S subunit